MALAAASQALLLLGCSIGSAVGRPGSHPESLLTWQDASELVQASVAIHGLRGRSGSAGGNATFWPSDEWQDDLTFLDPEQTSPSRKEEKEYLAGPDFLEQPWSRVLVLPDKKLAFCYIEKNACEQFNRLFNKMNGLEEGGPWWMSDVHSMGLDAAELTRGNGWKWGVFLRDPRLRYLSAWGSKCVQNEDKFGVNCLPQGSPVGDARVETFEANVMANSAHRDAMARNPHWAPQTGFCGGLRGTTDYDFVQVLRGNVNAKVRGMLRMVGASEEHVDEFFPPRSISGHHSSLNANDYYGGWSEVRRTVEEMYAEDFSLPGLSL